MTLKSLILTSTAILLSACTVSRPAFLPPTSLPSPSAFITPSPPAWFSALETRRASTATPRPPSTTDARPLSSFGPWLVFVSDGSIWASDGIVTKQLAISPYRPWDGVGFSPSPIEAVLALAAASPDSPESPPEMHLFRISFPDLSTTSLLSLIAPQQSDALSTQYPGNPLQFETDSWFYNEQIRAAVSRGRAVAWSPDGQHLAFVAALHSPNTDLYVFDALSERTTRLTSGPYQTANLIWSPTGRFIAHTSTSDINLGIRNGPTLIVEGLWSADTYSGRVTRLAGEDTGFLQWAGPDSALIYSDTASCGRFELRTVNAINGRSTLLWPGPFETAALDPESQALLVEAADYVPLASLADLCPPSEPSGLYVVPPGQPPRRLADYSSAYWSYHAWSMQPPLIWSPEVGLFFAFTPGGVIEITPDGHVTPSRAESIPFVSPSGQMWASGGSESPLRILHGDAPTTVFPSATCNAAWRPDDGALFFADGERLYSAISPEFRPREIYFSHDTDLCRSRLIWVTQ